MLSFTLFGIVLAANIGYSTQCLEGWHYFDADMTCSKGFNQEKTYDEAREVCQSYGGDLAKIQSEAKEKVIASLMTTYKTWIGLEDKEQEGHFTFVDGSKLGDYNSWEPNEPFNYRGDEDCVLMYYPNYWYAVNCIEVAHFVCSIQINCPEGWDYYPEGNQCVKSFDTPLSYNDARKTCQAEADDGDLAEIKNEDFTKFVLSLNLPMINWIGVQDSNDDQKFEYLDGSVLGDYHPWDDGEPNNWRGTEDCGMVYGQGGWAGKWNDAHCPDAHPFICSAASK